jgi:hypothetical protein
MTLGAVAAVAIAAAAWLYRDNRSLREELASAREAAPANGPVATAAHWEPPSADDDDGPEARGRLPSFLRLGRTPPPQLEPPKKETRAERRARRMAEIRAILGRDPGESEEDYRARVLPMLTAGLARPRSIVDEARRDAEAAAGVTPEQSAELDAIFDDAYSEALDLANAAIESGDLTPYERNVSGVLTVAGGLGAVLDSAQLRYDELLSPSQRAAMAGSGFDLGEYLGASAPWEKLDPPPPPPGDDG